MRNFLRVIALLFICVTFSNIIIAYATTKIENDVSILIDPSDREQYSNKFEAEIKINIPKKDLYNENVYLSYHIYDESGKEILWEGERYQLTEVIDGKIVMQVAIDLSGESSLASVNKGNIKFDIVDEKNAYWFSTNPKINLYSEDIIFDFSFWNNFTGNLTSSIVDNPLIFILNFLCFLLFIFSSIIIKRSGTFYN